MVLVKELQSITRPSISRVNRARARVLGGQLTVDIILENNDIVALGRFSTARLRASGIIKPSGLLQFGTGSPL